LEASRNPCLVAVAHAGYDLILVTPEVEVGVKWDGQGGQLGSILQNSRSFDIFWDQFLSENFGKISAKKQEICM
jgi:hypothetical protein